MFDINDYTVELVAIVGLADLRQLDADDNSPDYVVNVLAKHDATARIEVLVLAKNQGGINKFHQDFPTAGTVIGDGTPANHDEWRVLAFPNQIQTSTSPVEVFRRGRLKAKRDARAHRDEHE